MTVICIVFDVFKSFIEREQNITTQPSFILVTLQVSYSSHLKACVDNNVIIYFNIFDYVNKQNKQINWKLHVPHVQPYASQNRV